MVLAGVEEVGMQQVDLPTCAPMGCEVVIGAATQDPGKSCVALADIRGIDIGVAETKQQMAEAIEFAAAATVGVIRTEVEIVHTAADAVGDVRQELSSLPETFAAVLAVDIALNPQPMKQAEVGRGDPATQANSV